MYRGLRFIHLLGMILFLGSIFTFILISTMTNGVGLEILVFGRDIISTGTKTLTLPGMWLMTIAGVWMLRKRYVLKPSLFRLNLSIFILIVINAHAFVVPAASLATGLAHQSLLQQHLLPMYKGAYLRESIFGALNVLLALATVAFDLWKGVIE